MSVRSETLRKGSSRLLRAWLAVAAVLVAAVLALVLWTSFGPSITNEGTGKAPNEPGKITKMYDPGRFGDPIRIGDFVCHQCR